MMDFTQKKHQYEKNFSHIKNKRYTKKYKNFTCAPATHSRRFLYAFIFRFICHINVKNPRLKSRASDKKQKPLFVGLRFALIRFLLHLPDALPSGFSLTQALCQDPYPGSPTAVQDLKVDFHHGFHASPRYRCFIVWLFPFQECLFACDRF